MFKLGQVLVPTRLASCSALPLRVAASFSAAFGSSIDLLHVIDKTQPISAHPVEERFGQLLRCIPREVLPQIRLRLARGDLVECIVDTANQGYDLVLLEQTDSSEHSQHAELMRAVSTGVTCPVVAVSERDALSAFELMDLLLLRLCLRPPGQARYQSGLVSAEPGKYVLGGRSSL